MDFRGPKAQSDTVRKTLTVATTALHRAASRSPKLLQRTLLLHLLANTWNIWKKLLVQEEFLPAKMVRVRLRLPERRTAKSVTLMWSGNTMPWSVREGWIELTVPQVLVYESIRVDLV